AARALGRMRAAGSSSALVSALGDGAWPVRAQAAKALGMIGATNAVGALGTCLTDPVWWVRRHAAYALGGLGEGGQSALREIAARSDDRYAREMAQEVLSGGFHQRRAG